MKEILLKIMHLLAHKASKVTISILGFLAPVGFTFMLVGFAIVMDTIAGRWAARKVAEREGKDVRKTVTSKRTREGLVSKMITYQLALLSLYVMDYYVLDSVVKYFLPKFPINYCVTIIISLILVWVEWDSIDEKYYIVTGKRLNDEIKNRVKKGKSIIKSAANFKDEISSQKSETHEE